MLKMFRIPMLGLVTLIVVGLALGAAGTRPATAGDTDSPVAAMSSGGGLASQFFHVQWTSAPNTRGNSTITGYVYNDYGQPAKDVQVRISTLDPSGHVVTSEIRPVHGLVPAEGRAYFEANVPNSPSPYQVTVASFEFVEFPGKQ
ncbi:MAG TPA: FxLYD domain-containing protein [Candidatus Methylomirabilis sp.]|nr:FxLYD domain-containing protein [Candidatus Methylomirabilis sp.]